MSADAVPGTDEPESRVLLPGFLIRGYRSFHGETQYVTLPTKVTCVIGANNSGKSNVLTAISRFASPGSLARPLEGFEFPVSATGTRIDVDIEFGVAIDVGDDVVASLRRTIDFSRRREREGSDDVLLTNIGDHSALQAPNGPGSRLRWLRRRRHANGWSVSDEVLEALNPVVPEKAFSELILQTFGQSGGQASNITSLLDRWFDIAVPAVRIVPAQRGIPPDTATDSNVEEPHPSGRDLPAMLRGLERPYADGYHQKQAKFAAINAFLRNVIEDESATLAVAYDASTVNVILRDRVLPLENLGTGVSQVILIATLATHWDRSLVCIEEPELHLHPVHLRRLIRFLNEKTTNQYLIATHSAHVLDAPGVSVLRIDYDHEHGSTVSPAITPAERAKIAAHLGYRASDLLQANSVIWVEGPSDRVYLNHWIHHVAPELLEGIHYSIMFYGGRLLAHLTGEEMAASPEGAEDDFIHLLQINRNMAIVIDSDKRTAESPINDTKARIQREFEAGDGLAWVTAGREIENYVPLDTFRSAVEAARPRSRLPTFSADQWESRFADLPDSVNKVHIAVRVTESGDGTGELDLNDRIAELITFIRKAND